jgi:hypothetical protein
MSPSGSTFTSLVPTHSIMMLGLTGAARREDPGRMSKLMVSSECGRVALLRPHAQFTHRVGRDCVGSAPVRLLDETGEEVADGEPGGAALIRMTRRHARDWARHGVRVNALAPGHVGTGLDRAFFAAEAGLAQVRRIPRRRFGEPEELDGPPLLASQAGSFITGTAPVADGGHLVSPI